MTRNARLRTMCVFVWGYKYAKHYRITIKPCNDQGCQGENEAGCDGHQGKPLLREALARNWNLSLWNIFWFQQVLEIIWSDLGKIGDHHGHPSPWHPLTHSWLSTYKKGEKNQDNLLPDTLRLPSREPKPEVKRPAAEDLKISEWNHNERNKKLC